MKVIKRILAATIIFCFFLGGFYFFWLSPRYVVPILMYHRFGCDESTLFVTPENFKKQMSYLKNKGYNVISLDELAEGIKNKRKFSRNTVVITIDDGYKDNFIYAYPVLSEYNFPATTFIISNFIGRKENFLNWDEIQRMHKEGIFFGGHTANEAYLPSIKEKEILWAEIAGCKRFIESNIEIEANYFCYPTGGFTEEIKKMVRDAGYKGACTTNRGFAELNKDVYELKRVKVTNSDTNKPFSFWAKLSGYYNLFRSKKRGY